MTLSRKLAYFTKEDVVASFVLAFAPLTEPYRLFGVNLNILLLLIASIYLLSLGRKKFYLNTAFVIFLLYSISVPVLYGTSHGYTDTTSGFILTIAVFTAAYAIITPKASFDCISCFLRIFTNVACFVFIAQEITHLIWGVRFSGLLPFLDLKYDTISMADFIQNQIHSDRSSSIFLEPSHFAEYITLAFCIELAHNNKKGELFSKYAFFLTFCLIILRSGTGLLIVAFAWLFTYLKSSATSSKKVIATFVLVLGVVVVDYLGSNTTLGQEMLGRTSEITLDRDYNTSGSKRLFRGYWVFADMPMEAQFMGVTTDGLVTAIDKSSASVLFFDGSYFINNIQLLMIGTGFLGTLIFLFSIFKGYKKNGFYGKIILWSFLILCMLESFLFTPKMLLYMSLLEVIKTNNKRDNGNIITSN